MEGREDFPWRSKSGLPLHSAVSPQEEEFFERVQAVLERVATSAVLLFRSLPLAALWRAMHRQPRVDIAHGPPLESPRWKPGDRVQGEFGSCLQWLMCFATSAVLPVRSRLA